MDKTTEEIDSASISYRLLRISQERFGKKPLALDPEEYQQVRTIAAKEYLIEQAVLSSEEAMDVVVPKSQVDKVAEQILGRYEDEDSFYQDLAENELSFSDLKGALERELRVEAVLTMVASRSAKIDDVDINLFYYMNRDKFDRPERRKARHILITINPEFEENTRESALQRIEAIQQRVSKKPARFEEQAMKHSECPTSLQGGLLGEVKDDTLYPELSEVLFKMKEGQVSEVVESQVGFHILYCEAIYPAGIAPLSEVMEKLRSQLQERQSKQATRRWVKQLLQIQADNDDSMPAKELA